MNIIALKMLTGDRAKYLGLIFAIAFCTADGTSRTAIAMTTDPSGKEVPFIAVYNKQ